MCNFFSFKTDGINQIYYFSGEQRKANNLYFKNGDRVKKWDSHTSIEAYYGLKDTDWSSGEYNPYTDKLVIDRQHTEWDGQKVRGMLKKVDWNSLCGDLEGARAFIAGMKDIRWLDNHGEIPDGVKVFETRSEARDAAWDIARDATWNAARDTAWRTVRDAVGNAARRAARDSIGNAARNAAWDAALYANVLFTCAGLNIDQRHIDHVKKRWSVWEAGYGIYCDVGGVLYCYKRI